MTKKKDNVKEFDDIGHEADVPYPADKSEKTFGTNSLEPFALDAFTQGVAGETSTQLSVIQLLQNIAAMGNQLPRSEGHPQFREAFGAFFAALLAHKVAIANAVVANTVAQSPSLSRVGSAQRPPEPDLVETAPGRVEAKPEPGRVWPEPDVVQPAHLDESPKHKSGSWTEDETPAA